MQPSPDAPQKKPASLWPYIWKALFVVLLLMLTAAFLLPFGVNGLHKKQERTRAEAEIKGMSTALEGYKADHGNYPTDSNTTEQLQANATFDPADYIASSAFLYRALTGNLKASNQPDTTVYYSFPISMLKTDAQGRTYIVDPWGNSYGYSTFKAAHPDGNGGYNSTFDFWSTGGGKKDGDKAKWIINWQNSAPNVGQ
jgi:type II secretory pathway pseudopilin PulG